VAHRRRERRRDRRPRSLPRRPFLTRVRAATVEIYGADAPPPPPGATVYFRGTDERVGPLTKYAVVERHADPG
jgi:hypothetical protein